MFLRPSIFIRRWVGICILVQILIPIELMTYIPTVWAAGTNPNLGFYTYVRGPVAEGGGINLYMYCYNDPVNRIDPLGLDPPSSKRCLGLKESLREMEANLKIVESKIEKLEVDWAKSGARLKSIWDLMPDESKIFDEMILYLDMKMNMEKNRNNLEAYIIRTCSDPEPDPSSSLSSNTGFYVNGSSANKKKWINGPGPLNNGNNPAYGKMPQSAILDLVADNLWWMGLGLIEKTAVTGAAIVEFVKDLAKAAAF